MIRPALVLTLVAACAAAFCGLAAAATASTERLVLIDGVSTAQWQAVESTLTPALIEGGNALLFRVTVDWKTGEPNYPVGWPRIQRSLPPGQGDWRKWERIRLRVYVKKTGGPFPHQPIGITISSGDRNVSWEKDCTGLKAGAWQEFTFDLRDVPEKDKVKSLGIFISESEYADGDVLESYISDLELLRYGRPTLVGFTPLAAAAFADSKALPLVVDLLGVQPGATAPVEIQLSRGGETIAAQTAKAGEGETQVSLPLPRGLAPGDYSLSVRSDARTLSHSIILIESPWQEASR